MAEKSKVLVVDDSFLMRRIISDIVNSDPALEVVGKAKDGEDAIEKIISLEPDVVTLDVNLPVKDGIEVLEEIMKKKPTRVIMLSAYTRSGASATMRALELGAVDFIAKPTGEISLGLDKLKNEIISKIKLAANIDLEKYLSTFKRPSLAPGISELRPIGIKKLVIIGASTGGPKAILDIMQSIPADLPAAFLIVQHMPKGFTLSFAERIAWQSGLKAKEAEEGDIVSAGRVFVAPAGYHMVLDASKEKLKIKLMQGELVNFVRPSIDVTIFSAIELFQEDVIAIILTGMGKDGVEGARRIKERGGKVIVQDEGTSVIWGMPKLIAKAGLADEVLPLNEIAGALVKYIE
jgi:two-component system chemotaxis response regulator CheB